VVTNHFIYSNIDTMVKDLFIEHGIDGRSRVQTFTLAFQVDGLGGLSF
jgi:hypothetical protein